ncbi:MAG: chemotaxis protein CheD [Verrucomicrobiae bacterium]|nr:chemotaxis protein CheD [Verrucomicrobiae bacterium]
MKLPGPPIPQRHLQPGELLITQEPQWVITLLGSCVAVTMFHAGTRLAGICHAMLPRPHDKDSPGPASRYVSEVVPAMAAQFLKFGIRPAEVEVKMFGGGNVIVLGGEVHEQRMIGSANVAMARQTLQAARFQIRAENVGGQRGSKIAFNAGTGEVLHKHLTRGERPPTPVIGPLAGRRHLISKRNLP